MKTGHVLIVGQTESGKTICAQRIAAWYKSHNVATVVLDPMKDPKWNADFITADPVEFFSLIKDPNRCLNCAAFVDESGDSLNKYASDEQFLTTRSRHHGIVAHIIAQRAQQVSVTVRSQCSTLYAFSVSPADAKIYASDFNCDELLKCPTLPQGTCIRVQRFQPPRYLRMW